jgi:hypothetical protein
MYKNKYRFKHSGDLGDIIYSLPTIRALGGGILYLDPTGGESDPLVCWGINNRYKTTSLNSKTIDLLKPLLLQQDYIKGVELWDESVSVDYNLNEFRKSLVNHNLSDCHLNAFNLPYSERDSAWLKIDQGLNHESGRKTLLLRSLRVQSNHTFWENLPDEMIQDALFVGSPFEYEVFSKTFRYEVPFWELSILDLARAIYSCNSFISNQTFGAALAEGFKKNLIQEVYRIFPLALFEREEAAYV